MTTPLGSVATGVLKIGLKPEIHLSILKCCYIDRAYESGYSRTSVLDPIRASQPQPQAFYLDFFILFWVFSTQILHVQRSFSQDLTSLVPPCTIPLICPVDRTILTCDFQKCLLIFKGQMFACVANTLCIFLYQKTIDNFLGFCGTLYIPTKISYSYLLLHYILLLSKPKGAKT